MERGDGAGGGERPRKREREILKEGKFVFN